MENTRKNLCARILVWNARNGLKHMLLIKLSPKTHFEILTRNYARNERAASDQKLQVDIKYHPTDYL